MKRTSWILVGTLLVLIIATILVLQRPGERNISPAAGKGIVSYDSAAVDKIEIHSTGTDITLQKAGGKWMVTSPVNYAADPSSVGNAISKGMHLDVESPVSTNPEKQSLFRVDSSATLVTLFANGKDAAAFYIGKPGPSFRNTYVREKESNNVYLVDGMLSTVYHTTAKDWRDKTIFKEDQSQITSVKFQYGDTTFALTFNDSTWSLDGDSVAQQAVTTLLGALSHFQADDFIDSPLTNPPKITAAVTVDGTQIRFYPAENNKYYVQTSASPQWFEVQGWKANQVLKRKKELLK